MSCPQMFGERMTLGSSAPRAISARGHRTVLWHQRRACVAGLHSHYTTREWLSGACSGDCRASRTNEVPPTTV
jgi:hypothetical protein